MIDEYLNETIEILKQIDRNKIQQILDILKNLNGRLFILGVGGSAGNASHAVNDFRKIMGIEAYTPTDNVSELTAITNDDGWENTFQHWLLRSKLNKNDCILVFSVGGGTSKTSSNIVQALEYGKFVKCKIIGIVGRDGGFTHKVADVCLIIPTVNEKTITPHTEEFQSIIWHLIVNE